MIYFIMGIIIIAIIFCGHIYPFFKKKLNMILSKIPYKVKSSIINLSCIILVVDTILSCIRYINI